MEPIQVSATPTQAQIAAGVRQIALSLGIIAAAFGFSGLATKANLVVSLAPQFAAILAIAGPAVWAAAAWLGQISTRSQAKKLAITAAAAPDSVAMVK